MSTPIARETFKTSRLMDFFSVKELTAQIGHDKDDWPLVAIKELLDNAIDACEDHAISPEICVEVDETGITLEDNGPGIPPDTITGVLDYSVRVSSREAYVSPCRGAQGNALKTLVAMPYVLDGQQGVVEITAQGIHHTITCRVDRLRQIPVIDHQQAPEIVKNGTRFILHWPDSSSSILRMRRDRILQMLEGYVILNPHLTLRGRVFQDTIDCAASMADWPKWKPSDPTSPHWYTVDHLARLVSALLIHDEDLGREPRLVRELVAQFKGLTSTAKQKAVLEATGLARQPLTALVKDGAINQERVSALLKAMQTFSAPLKPQALGVIGKDHLVKRFTRMGCEMESFEYARELDVKDGIPFVLEMAFAWHPHLENRHLITGVNWSPGILDPFRNLGALGRSLGDMLTARYASRDEPIIFLAHLAAARVAYSDRGKSAVLVEG